MPAASSRSCTVRAYSSCRSVIGITDDLHRREPHRKRAGVVLDQNAEEALDRSVQRAMHHQRLMRFAVLGDVFEARSGAAA